jgi:hypothetical protein
MTDSSMIWLWPSGPLAWQPSIAKGRALSAEKQSLPLMTTLPWPRLTSGYRRNCRRCARLDQTSNPAIKPESGLHVLAGGIALLTGKKVLAELDKLNS